MIASRRAPGRDANQIRRLALALRVGRRELAANRAELQGLTSQGRIACPTASSSASGLARVSLSASRGPPVGVNSASHMGATASSCVSPTNCRPVFPRPLRAEPAGDEPDRHVDPGPVSLNRVQHRPACFATATSTGRGWPICDRSGSSGRGRSRRCRRPNSGRCRSLQISGADRILAGLGTLQRFAYVYLGDAVAAAREFLVDNELFLNSVRVATSGPIALTVSGYGSSGSAPRAGALRLLAHALAGPAAALPV